MKCEAVLFDLDGTLIETPIGYVLELLNKVLSELNGIKISEKEAAGFWFSSDMDQYLLNFGVEKEAFWYRFRQYDNCYSRSKVIRPYPDTYFLDELTKKGIPLGIITSAPKEIANLEINLLNSVKFKTSVFTQPIYGIQPKPNPEGIEIALNSLGVSPCNTLYVGNGAEDIEFAKNANIFNVFIERTDYPYSLSLIPNAQIKSLLELTKFV